MMGLLWVVLFVALTGSQVGHGLPIGSSPPSYPHESPQDGFGAGWGSQRGLLAAAPALALVLTAAGLLLGCTWCYRHKDCKQNQGNDNQLFSASATHLQDGSRRSAAPDSGFSEPSNNNVSEDNNNGPISLREMQNIANNNAAAYIVSENEERNRAASRESVVEFEPLPVALGGVQDPLERCADWFGADDFPRSRLQYLREIGRGWFGRIVEGELETTEGSTSTVAVKILNQNATSEEKARFLEEARIYRDVRHDHVLGYVARCLQEDPWILLFELCSMDLQQYLVSHRDKMAALNEAGVPLRLQCDVTAALAYLHSHGLVYGDLCTENVLVRGSEASARAVLGRYSTAQPPPASVAPDRVTPTTHSEVWSTGTLLWQVCAWGAAPDRAPAPEPREPCPYRAHLYQVMQLCWNPNSHARPTAAQVHSLLQHLYTAHKQLGASHAESPGDFEARWQTLKPNTIPKIDEHVAMVHAPSTSTASHFTGSETIQDSLSVDLDTAVSRSSSIMSDKDHLSVQMKSESLNNLHGSLEDVGSVYHNESAVESLTNVSLNDSKDKEQDRSDSSMDPWLKDIIAGSQDDVSYYKDVSDVIKNLDNILNSEKTSSSESSHQASPSRDNLSLDCKKEYPPQSSLVKSPGISNFQNILDLGYEERDQPDDDDRETIGTLSHSFERHSDTNSQHTLENLTPDTPIKDLNELEREMEPIISKQHSNVAEKQAVSEKVPLETEMPKEVVTVSNSEAPQQRELVESMSSVSEGNIEQLNVQDCQTSCDKFKETVQNDTHESNRAKSDNAISNLEDESEILALPVEEVVTETNVQKVNTQPVPEVPETEVDVEQVVIEIKDNNQESEIREHASNFVDQLIRQTADIIEHEREYSAHRNMPIRKLENIVVSNHHDSKDKDIDKSEEYIRSENENNDSDVIKSFSVESSCNDKDRDENEDSREIVLEINSIADLEEPTQVNYDEIVFEDKHMSGEDNLLDGANEVHQSEPSSAADILPDIIGNIDLPSDEAKTKSISESLETHSLDTQSTLPLGKPDDIVQIINESKPQLINECTNVDNDEIIKEIQEEKVLPKCYTTLNTANNESTIYMDLINDAKSDVTNKTDTMDSDMKQVIKSCVDSSNVTNDTNECTLVRNDSTVYMDLPTVLSETDKFLHSERVLSSQVITNVIANETKFDEAIPASTPKGSDCEEREEANNVSLTKLDDLSETKTPDYGPGVTLTKLEQKFVPDNISPFDSPTKSHPTDTYDENSSVVLGPFENCSLELFKGIKSATGYTEIDAAKEELLAFSSNFSDINLETPSPLRDSNFLNEVPDIEINDDLIFDDINEMSEAKSSEAEPVAKTLDHTDGPPPSTPPNSPGTSLGESSQAKYVIDIDLSQPEILQSGSGMGAIGKEIDLNQIETTKLAMAENENNLNIEYSGPIEGLMSDDSMEAYLAGNGLVSVEEPREAFALDEASMQALRNELELKLPLAQVASVEPSDDIPPWSGPDLVVNYPGALSPIAEETGHQLSAYENDRIWNTSIRTDSSESYLEPCNNSTDEVTELPTGALNSAPQGLTYTVNSGAASLENNTYTLQRDATTSRDLTMSADSLNASPAKKNENNTPSPVNDRTYNKEDEKEAKCERLSQVSPFLLSPTTDTSAPERSDNLTGVSTLSQSTVPTDAKISKPTDTACLSKATSIDSWCSNDTLYNVEENFDDLAVDADVAPQDFEEDKDHSESSDTLTHNDDDKELSHCSTYIVHDSKSEGCDTFSPDSITANCTYTKPKTETAEKSPALVTPNESSTKNSQTKDLAYGTLGSYSNCTTELLSAQDEYWKLPQPELVRRSPIGDDMANLTPPVFSEKVNAAVDSPQLESEPSVNRMESVDISCLHDGLVDDSRISSLQHQATSGDSPNFHYRNMAQSVQSTPILETEVQDDVTPIPMQLPEINTPSSEFSSQIPNFQSFINSAELRPQDMSSNQDTGLLLEGESRSLSRNSTNRDIRSPTYSDFESSALARPQDLHSKSSQSVTSGASSEDFHVFENSVRNRPQDLSSVPNLSLPEGVSSDLAPEASTNEGMQEDISEIRNEQNAPSDPVLGTESYFAANFILIDEVPKVEEPEVVDETEQPHSIIITESPKNAETTSANVTYDSHTETKLNLNNSYDSHESKNQQLASETHPKNLDKSPLVNGIEKASPKNIVNETTQNEIEAAMENFEVFRTDPVVMNVVTETCPQLALPNGCHETESKDSQCNGTPAQYATVNFINESFEKLRESNVDGHDTSKTKIDDEEQFETYTEMNLNQNGETNIESVETGMESLQNGDVKSESKVNGVVEEKKVTESFLENEKNFCQLDSYLILNDIRFTGPASEIMSTSFTSAPPSEPTSPEDRSQAPPPAPAAADLLKEWDSDSDDSRSSNPSSGEFIWKNRGTGAPGGTAHDAGSGASGASDGLSGSGSGSGSEGDEVEFVPSSWDCRAEPGKSSLRSLEQHPESKKRVVFKRQKYHCVYEYPREASDACELSPAAALPDYSTYADWAAAAAEDAELSYSQLYGGHPFDMSYPLRAGGVSFGSDYDEDFFISSSAHPFESLGLMSTSSQFFPGLKGPLLERRDSLTDDVSEEYPPPPSPLHSALPAPPLSLDFTTPDSGVEDITPGSTSTEDDFKTKKEETEATQTQCWKSVDSASSSESVSPSSPGEALGGLRHTRDKLKLDLPPSPCAPSPRHHRVFNFVLDKPRPRARPTPDPVVMTDDTPLAGPALPLPTQTEDLALPPPTFSTFGKQAERSEEREEPPAIVLTDEAQAGGAGGTGVDSGDEDSGIESSAKTTLERKQHSPNVS